MPTARAMANSRESIGGLCEDHVDGKDDQHQHGHDLREQVPEAPDAALELGLRRAQRQPLGNLAERGVGAGLHDERHAPCRCARSCP